MARKPPSVLILFICFLITLTSLILSLLSLSSAAQVSSKYERGTHTNKFKKFALLTLNTSDVNFQLYKNTSIPIPIYDWYELHYLAVCYGWYIDHYHSGSFKKLTYYCDSKSIGYKFSLVEDILSGTGSAHRPINRTSTYGTFDTKTPAGLFLTGFSFCALATIGFFCTCLWTYRGTKVERGFLRPTVVFSGLAGVFLVAAAAETTVLAQRVGVSTDLDLGTAFSSLDRGFYAAAWSVSVLMLVAFSLGFGISVAGEREDREKVKTQSGGGTFN